MSTAKKKLTTCEPKTAVAYARYSSAQQRDVSIEQQLRDIRAYAEREGYTIVHEYADHIIGRMGIPYREAGLSLISIAACAPVDRINALTGNLGRLPGVSAKAVYAPAKRRS